RAAIAAAIAEAAADDVVLLAGKGHEDYQEIAGVRHPYSDRDTVRRFLALVAEVLRAPLIGRDATFTGVGTDTRTLAAGDLFVALVGPNFDGHSFLPEAIAKGAAGALLSRPLETPLPYVRVPETRAALGSLAAFWRR